MSHSAGRKPVIAITSGDLNGIGPEIALKSIGSRAVRAICSPLLVGPLHVFAFYARTLGLKLIFREVDQLPARLPVGTIPVLEPSPFVRPSITPGALSAESGMHCGEAITAAAHLCRLGKADGMVTAPSSKESMALGGYHYPGQTEMLTALCCGGRVMMVLVAGNMRVGLATVHLPLRRVASALTRPLLVGKLSIFHRSLRADFGLRKPRIAVIGVNPHAGEGGLIGQEEIAVIAPAIRRARTLGMVVEGPFPADGFFGSRSHERYDGVLAMYHDQGLIPVKMEGFTVGVNYSAGLPIVRTSPDHGTAFDIAGKGVADPGSMTAAITLAVAIVHQRNAHPFSQRG